jgi:hypothetical protein
VSYRRNVTVLSLTCVCFFVLSCVVVDFFRRRRCRGWCRHSSSFSPLSAAASSLSSSSSLVFIVLCSRYGRTPLAVTADLHELHVGPPFGDDTGALGLAWRIFLFNYRFPARFLFSFLLSCARLIRPRSPPRSPAPSADSALPHEPGGSGGESSTAAAAAAAAAAGRAEMHCVAAARARAPHCTALCTCALRSFTPICFFVPCTHPRA